ncbi:MAG: NAD(P)-dependent oxidoreductase [Kiritimatiellia bacterium]
MGSAPPETDRSGPLPILPVSLLLKDRPCLVVGAGNVAVRKVEHLITAGAKVTVIGDMISPGAHELHRRGLIHLKVRAFEDDDVVGCAAVFAATDSAEANLRVLEACRERGILCGCVDLHWRESDLISPAVLRVDDITISVSTGGKSCRRSRLVRDSMMRHLSGINTAELLIIGTSFRQLGLKRLEALCLNLRPEETGKMLKCIWGLHEFMLLSTCNRVELWALAAAGENLEELLRRALGLGGLKQNAYYIHQGFDAFRHSSLLAAGLLSQSPGESHIVSQVKVALDSAKQAGWAGSILQEWASSALHISKEVRSAVSGMIQSRDVEEMVMERLAAEQPSFPDMRGMVIGTGEVGNRLMQLLAARPGHGRICWCYRNHKPALPPEWAGRVSALDFSEIGPALRGSDYIIVAAGGTEPVLLPDHASRLKPAGDVLIIDVGMPRNVAPELAARADNVHLVNLCDLKRSRQRKPKEIAAAVQKGHQIVDGHRDLYDKNIRNIQSRYTE